MDPQPCYVDESGTPEVPGTSSHFVLAGIAIPIWHWRDCDREINIIKRKYGLDEAEIHTAWLLRAYQEQSLVENLEEMPFAERRRRCIDKLHHDPARNRGLTVGEQAFEQVVSRFEHFLRATERAEQRNYGLLIHDNNETVAKKHTSMMIKFHQSGTFWTRIMNIIETPLFVNSQLTSMVQIADLCGYALRRYVENGETTLFENVFARGDRRNNAVVGVRHFCSQGCACMICEGHVAQDELPLQDS